MALPPSGQTCVDSRPSDIWFAALLYVALTLLFVYPLVIHIDDHVLAVVPDAFLYMWTLAWDTHAFIHQPFSIFDANIFYPERGTLAYSENLIGSAIFAAPVLWLSGNIVLTINVVELLSTALCGLGAYVLARRVGVGKSGAVVSGLIFAFSPPRFLRMDQLHMTAIQWMPFSLASQHAYWDGGRRRDLRLAAAFFTLQVLSSGHGAVFLTIASLSLLAYRMTVGQRLDVGGCLRDLGLPGALLLAPAALVALPYLAIRGEMGLKRGLDWEIPPSSFLASPTYVHSFVLSLFPHARINETAGGEFFPGYLPLVLAAACFWWPGARFASSDPRRRRVALFYGLLTLVSLWLSIGPPFGLWRFVYWLPGLNFIRAASRFTLLALLGLAILAGAGFDRVADRFRPSRRLMLAVCVGGLLLAEFAVPVSTTPYTFDNPAVDRWLAGRRAPFAVAEAPVQHRLDERRQTTYMLHSTAHWQRTVHGYSGLRPPLHENLYEQLTRFPDEESLRSLEGLGVNYVVVHTDLYPPGEWRKVNARIESFAARLKLEHVDGAGRIYSIPRAAE